MRIFSFFLLLGLTASGWAQTISEKLSAMNQVFPSEKIYLHTDRTFYATSDDVHFKVYAVNGETHRPDLKSNTISVNLLDAKGSVLETRTLALYNGKAWGCFQLKSLPGGIYKIKAFTNWTGNIGEDYIFEKEITVRKAVYVSLLLKMETERKSYLPGQRVNAWIKAADLENHPITNSELNFDLRYESEVINKGTIKTDNTGKAIFSFDIPDTVTKNDLVLTAHVYYEGKQESVFKPVEINLKEMAIDFLPEGGNMVNGLSSVVAFRAIQPNGKSVEVEGTIVDETGNTIAAFSSVKFGMGKFSFTPTAGHTYTALVDAGDQKTQRFKLPAALANGITVQCPEGKPGIRIYASTQQEVSLFWYAHGKIYADKTVTLQPGENSFDLPADSISPGIAKLTVFKGAQPVCERLIFVNKDKTLSVNIQPDRDQYSPFEPVKMTVNVKDYLGNPVQGSFSLAVVDEKNLTMADDKQDNILSSLLMSSELQGKMEEPSFYFKKDEPLANELLDLVMLTHGWRRYNWPEVLTMTTEDWKSRIKFEPDIIGYSGSVYLDGYEPVRGNIKVTLLNPVKSTILSDENGHFFLPYDKLAFPVKLRFRKNGYSEKTLVQQYELSRSSTAVTYNPFAPSATSVMSVEIAQQKQLKKSVAVEEEPVKGEIINYRTDDKAMSALSLVDGVKITGGTLSSEVQLSSVEVTVSPQRNGLSASDIIRSEQRVSSVTGFRYTLDPFSSNYDYVSSGRAYYMHSRFRVGPSGYSFVTSYNKEFYSPFYNGYNDHQKKTDDRKTLYWQHNVITDKEGKAEVKFYTCKNVTAYTATLEGMSDKGETGMGTAGFYVQKPLELQVKLPVVITRGDRFIAKCVITNHTGKDLDAKVNISQNMDFSLLNSTGEFTCTVPADSFLVKEIEVKVLEAPAAVTTENKNTGSTMSIHVEAGDLADEISGNITVNRSGFDYSATVGGNDKEKTFSFNINNPANTEFTAKLEVIVDPFKDLDQNLRAMVNEPHGCFEQVSATNYPNILALQYLQKKAKADPEFTARTIQHLKTGYAQLAKYETSQHGFEWYGHTPPHEALTAMGLMQFYEMKKLGIDVDEKMFQRNMKWLMGRRTFSGEFEQNQGKYGFSGAPRATSSAYITYALSSMGEKDLDKEIKAIEKDTRTTFDFYKLALLANTYFNMGDTEKGTALVAKLVQHVKENGIDKIKTGPSFTYCSSPVVECIAFLTLSITENNLVEYKSQVMEYTGYIYGKRTYGGHFGSTQQTVMAIRALMSANDFLESITPRAGEMQVWVNNHALPLYSISALSGINDVSLGKYLVKGKNTVKLVCSASSEKAPPYLFGASWKETLPEKTPDSKVQITTAYPQNEFNEGETARLNITLTNTTKQGLPQTVAVIGTPAGMSFDSPDLKRLMEEKLFDYYELKDNYLILYYAELAPSAVINIPLNLKSEIQGTFSTPPACTYLYYNPEYKSWSTTNNITIR